VSPCACACVRLPTDIVIGFCVNIHRSKNDGSPHLLAGKRWDSGPLVEQGRGEVLGSIQRSFDLDFRPSATRPGSVTRFVEIVGDLRERETGGF